MDIDRATVQRAKVLTRRTRRGCGGTPGDGTWLALLAATSVGVNACAVRAEVVAENLRRGYDGCYRLVVHSYSREDLSSDGVLDEAARPHGSAQRSVTAEELRHGVRVSLVELGPRRGPAVVLAWVEEGDAELEFGGFEARPGRGALVVGVGQLEPEDGNGRAHVVLRETG